MRHATHKEWVKNEFKNEYLKTSFRNSIIHFSIIESIVISRADKSSTKYSTAIKSLLCNSIISREEFCLLDRMGNNRNKLIHRIIKKHLDQDQIDTSRDELMGLIIKVYKDVIFIKKYLMSCYGIDTIKIKT